VTAQPVAVLGERFGVGRPSAWPTISLNAALAGVRRVGDGNDDG
jgi:hypothetical protein